MKTVLAIVSILILTACSSIHQRADGTYDVPRSVEVRSIFGTNAGFVKLEHCLTRVEAGTWNLFDGDTYTNCHTMKSWVATSSQGQGGQIVGGALMGLGFGLGSTFAPASSSNSAANSSAASSSASSITTITKGHGH